MQFRPETETSKESSQVENFLSVFLTNGSEMYHDYSNRSDGYGIITFSCLPPFGDV